MVLAKLEAIQKEFNKAQAGGKKISMADLIVLAGCAGVEKAAKDAGFDVKVPFAPGRMDASQEQTDVEGLKVLEPFADGFRNYLRKKYTVASEDLLIEKSHLIGLTPPEMTVLVGGMRALNTNFDNSDYGILTTRPGVLTNDFFLNLLDMATVWVPASEDNEKFHGIDRTTGKRKWNATRVDLIFGANSELRALAEVYACSDGREKFVYDFVAAWDKVMNLDRFELKPSGEKIKITASASEKIAEILKGDEVLQKDNMVIKRIMKKYKKTN
jgi:catalase-peroxidase